jgi:hypothetical protein
MYNKEQRRTPLAEMVLVAGVRTLAGRLGLKTLDDLAHLDSNFLRIHSVGRATVRSLIRDIGDHFAREEDESSIAQSGLVEGFARLVAELEPRRRLILEERSGLRGAPRMLAQIAEDFGITRSRVQMLEDHAFKSLKRRAWAREVTRRVELALEERVSVPLVELTSDLWWASAAQKASVAAYVVKDVLDLAATVASIDGAVCLARPQAAARRGGASRGHTARVVPLAPSPSKEAKTRRSPRQAPRVDLDTEIDVLARHLAAELIRVIKIAALEAVADGLKRGQPGDQATAAIRRTDSNTEAPRSALTGAAVVENVSAWSALPFFVGPRGCLFGAASHDGLEERKPLWLRPKVGVSPSPRREERARARSRE